MSRLPDEPKLLLTLECGFRYKMHNEKEKSVQGYDRNDKQACFWRWWWKAGRGECSDLTRTC